MPKYVDIESIVITYTGHTPNDDFSKGVDLVLFELDSMPGAPVRPPISKAERGICTRLVKALRFCTEQTAGCGLCPQSDRDGCTHTKLLLAAANAIERLMQEETS